MSIAELEQRLVALEHAVQKLQAQPVSVTSDRWWTQASGRFADDPVFDEIVKLGAEFRHSLRQLDAEDGHDHP